MSRNSRPARRATAAAAGTASPIVVRRLTLAALLLVVAAMGWLWLRDSSLARVEQVRVTGASSSQKEAVEDALRDAATDMTTLHVREDALRAAVEPYESVRDLRVEPDFPHTLHIDVIEKRMVAVVSVGGAETAVGAEGRLLRGVEPAKPLPEIEGGRVVASDRLSDGRALSAVAVLAAAPAELHARVERARRGDRGLILEMRDGPDLIFGDRHRVRAKWAAAARVLAEPSAVGSVYVDVRLPERVAAGGVAPTPEPTPTAVAGVALPVEPPGTTAASSVP